MKPYNHAEHKQENWIVVRDTHEPIISRDMFEAVQTFREQVAQSSIRREKASYTPNIFKGKMDLSRLCEVSYPTIYKYLKIVED